MSFLEWIKTKTGKLHVSISAAFTGLISIIPILRLFGIDHIPLPVIRTTQDTWLVTNLAVHFAFIGYVTFFTSYKYSHIQETNKADLIERPIWERLTLTPPNSKPPEREDKGGNSIQDDEIRSADWIKFKIGVNKVVKQFVWFWALAWFSWFLNYGYMLAERTQLLGKNQATQNLLNNVNSLMFVFLFMTLTVSTSKYGILFWGKLVSFVLAAFGIELVSTFATHGSAGVGRTFTILSGLFAATALAAFVGSINSKFINIPIWLVGTLYLYAALQSLYVFVEPGDTTGALLVETTEIVITLLAFVLKAILFVTVTWILRTGRLVYFMIEESSLNFAKDKSFSEFLKILRIGEAELT